MHAFEPSCLSRVFLTARFADQSKVTIHPTALSNESGKATFYSNGDAAGTNSLSSVSGPCTEIVVVGTLDEFLQRENIESVAMIKIDTEGFDSLVLRGAGACLARGAVEVVQFEYNWRWLLNHACLRDVFEFIRDKPYRFCKLTGRSVDYYDVWHHELDRFFESNCALVRRDSPLCALGRSVHFDSSSVAIVS